MTSGGGTTERRGREGGKWINERPTSQEFSEWFEASMKMDPALDVKDYVGGVVLIPGVDSKVPHVVGFTESGAPIIERREELSYTPYAKVEARNAYFWDLLEAHPEWVGEVEHVVSERPPLDFITEEERRPDGEGFTEIRRRQPSALTVLVHQLPDGFSIMSVPVREGYTHFLCCTTRVAIYKRGEDGEPTGRPLRVGRGTKQVPLLTGYRDNPFADPSSLMKAETGSMGRALGFAGIFVIPGSGVATAEDMLEAISQGAPPAEAAPGNAGPAAPAQPVRTGAERAQDDDDALRARAIALYKALSEEAPERATAFGEWAKQRKLTSLGDAKGALLRGVVRKLEKLKDEAEAAAGRERDTPPAAAEQPTEEGGHVPGQAADSGDEAG